MATYRKRQDEWHSGHEVVWRRMVIGQHLELEADFPSVLQCDFILCDPVEQLEEKEENSDPCVFALGDAAVILTKVARQTCLRDTDFISQDPRHCQSHFSITKRCRLALP